MDLYNINSIHLNQKLINDVDNTKTDLNSREHSVISIKETDNRIFNEHVYDDKSIIVYTTNTIVQIDEHLSIVAKPQYGILKLTNYVFDTSSNNFSATYYYNDATTTATTTTVPTTYYTSALAIITATTTIDTIKLPNFVVYNNGTTDETIALETILCEDFKYFRNIIAKECIYFHSTILTDELLETGGVYYPLDLSTGGTVNTEHTTTALTIECKAVNGTIYASSDIGKVVVKSAQNVHTFAFMVNTNLDLIVESDYCIMSPYSHLIASITLPKNGIPYASTAIGCSSYCNNDDKPFISTIQNFVYGTNTTLRTDYTIVIPKEFDLKIDETNQSTNCGISSAFPEFVLNKVTLIDCSVNYKNMLDKLRYNQYLDNGIKRTYRMIDTNSDFVQHFTHRHMMNCITDSEIIDADFSKSGSQCYSETYRYSCTLTAASSLITITDMYLSLQAGIKKYFIPSKMYDKAMNCYNVSPIILLGNYEYILSYFRPPSDLDCVEFTFSENLFISENVFTLSLIHVYINSKELSLTPIEFKLYFPNCDYNAIATSYRVLPTDSFDVVYNGCLELRLGPNLSFNTFNPSLNDVNAVIKNLIIGENFYPSPIDLTVPNDYKVFKNCMVKNLYIHKSMVYNQTIDKSLISTNMGFVKDAENVYTFTDFRNPYA